MFVPAIGFLRYSDSCFDSAYTQSGFSWCVERPLLPKAGFSSSPPASCSASDSSSDRLFLGPLLPLLALFLREAQEGALALHAASADSQLHHLVLDRRCF